MKKKLGVPLVEHKTATEKDIEEFIDKVFIPTGQIHFSTGKEGAILQDLAICREFDPEWNSEKEAARRKYLEETMKPRVYTWDERGFHGPE